MDFILETHKDFDIIFIQKPLWTFIYTILNFSNKDGDRVVGAPKHSNWITFSKPFSSDNEYP